MPVQKFNKEKRKSGVWMPRNPAVPPALIVFELPRAHHAKRPRHGAHKHAQPLRLAGASPEGPERLGENRQMNGDPQDTEGQEATVEQ